MGIVIDQPTLPSISSLNKIEFPSPLLLGNVREEVIYSKRFDRFRIADHTEPSEISTGLPLNPAQELSRLWVASSRYEVQGYLQDIQTVDVDFSPLNIIVEGEDSLKKELTEDQYSKFKEKGIVLRFQKQMSLYIDQYHYNSIPIYGVMGGISQGSTRIILPSSEKCLPTFADDAVVINSEYSELVKKSQAELSQFAIVKNAHLGMSGALLRSAVSISRELGINYWIATIDNYVIRHLNGAYFRFDLPKVGPESMYLGSQSTPIFIDIESALANAANFKSSEPMSHFISGKIIPKGFEWYKGI